ncbi:MAG: hypothetical protein ABSB89_10820 [Candidatus Bathyarchaeia archaeon]|jgi:hypothetical protein
MSNEENSEENENQKKPESRIKIEIERSKELEGLASRNIELERANAELEQKAGEPDYQKILEEQAVQKFTEECNKYGLDPTTTKPEVLKAVKEIKQIEEMTSPKAPKGGETANFYDLGNSGRKEPISGEALDAINVHSDTVSVDLCKWSSESAMVKGIKAIASNSEDRRQKEAKKLLSLLAKKLINEPSSEFEYNGKLSDLQKVNKKNRKGEFVRADKNES